MPRVTDRTTPGSLAFDAFLVAHDLSSKRAGERLGVSDVTVYHWRIGAKTPSDLSRKKIEIFTRHVDADGVTQPGIQPSAWSNGSEEEELAGVVPLGETQQTPAA